MDKSILKNIDPKTVLDLREMVAYQKGQIVSRTLVQNNAVSMTLFSFDEGEEISTHASGGDAMVYLLDGTAQITIGGEEFILEEGNTIVMPANIPHAVLAKEPFKMLLIVVFSS